MDDSNISKLSIIISIHEPPYSNSAYAIITDLQNTVNGVKSDILLALNNNSNYEILFQYVNHKLASFDYPKKPNYSAINNWLDKFELSIEDVLKGNITKNQFDEIIDIRTDFEFTAPVYESKYDFKEIIEIQKEFVKFFKYYFVDHLLTFMKDLRQKIESTKSNKSTNTEIKSHKPFKEEYLITFCESIDYQNIKEVGFTALYESIQHYTPYLESEILENISILPNDKVKDYLQFVIDKIQKTPYYNFNPDILSKWVTKYNLDLSKFPCYDNRELREILDDLYDDYEKTPAENQLMLSIQTDFFCYAAMLEAKYMVNYVEELIEQRTPQLEILNDNSNKLKWIGKPSQLGFIVAHLVEMGYIEAPLKRDGEINYTQFAKHVKQTFNVDTTEASLQKYLNINSDKGQEPFNKFLKNDFNIPHIKTVS